MSAWDSDYYDDDWELRVLDEEEYEAGMDEDYYSLTCPVCEKSRYFGEFLLSKNMCVFCSADLKENAPMKPLIDLVEKSLHQDACGKA